MRPKRNVNKVSAKNNCVGKKCLNAVLTCASCFIFKSYKSPNERRELKSVSIKTISDNWRIRR